MKKLLFAAVIILCSAVAHSQSVWHWGLKGGASFSFSKTNVNGNISAGVRPGYFGGGILEFSPGDSDSHIKLQLEAMYNDLRVNYPGTTLNKGIKNEKLSIQQVSIPLLMKIVVITPLTINVGPTFNMNIGGNEELLRSSDGSIKKDLNSDNYKSFQLGGVLGASYNFYSHFFVDARYVLQLGHTNNTKDGKEGFEYLNPSKVKWNYAQVGIGYMF